MGKAQKGRERSLSIRAINPKLRLLTAIPAGAEDSEEEQVRTTSLVDLDSNCTLFGKDPTTGALSDSREKMGDLGSDVESPKPESPAGIAGLLSEFWIVYEIMSMLFSSVVTLNEGFFG